MKKLTLKTMATALHTMGFNFTVNRNGYDYVEYDVTVSKPSFSRLIATNTVRELREWFLAEGMDKEFDSIVRMHGEKAIKEYPYPYNLSS